jgi:hypothetical protein
MFKLECCERFDIKTWVKRFNVQGSRLKSPKGCILRGFRIHRACKAVTPNG